MSVVRADAARGRRRTLALYECRLAWRDPVLWIALIVLLAAVSVAWSMSQAWVDAQETLQQSLLAEEQERLAGLQRDIDAERGKLEAAGTPLAPVTFGFRHATNIGHYSGQRWMVQPPLATAALAIGERDLQPGAFLASLDRWQGDDRGEFTSPLWLRFGRFDLFFVTGYLLPLILILVCAGTVSSEKERQTLHLRLAQGTRPWTLALARLALKGGGVTLVLGLSVALLSWRAGVVAEGQLPRLMLWEAGLVAYAALWLALIAWVDAGGRSVAANLLMCTGVWIVVLLVLPGLATAAADAWTPLESRAAFGRSQRDAYQDVWSHSNDGVLRTFYAEHPEIPPIDDPARSLERYMAFQMRALDLIAARLGPIEGRLNETAARHRAFTYAARFASPVLLLHDVLSTAAGSDMPRIEDLWRQREHFLTEWHDFYAPRIYARVPIEDLRATPAFRYAEPALRARAPAMAMTLLGLLAPAALIAAAAARGYRRFPL